MPVQCLPYGKGKSLQLYCLPDIIRILTEIRACFLSTACKDVLNLLGVRKTNLNLYPLGKKGFKGLKGRVQIRIRFYSVDCNLHCLLMFQKSLKDFSQIL